jgi:hypothetical protein
VAKKFLISMRTQIANILGLLKQINFENIYIACISIKLTIIPLSAYIITATISHDYSRFLKYLNSYLTVYKDSNKIPYVGRTGERK